MAARLCRLHRLTAQIQGLDLHLTDAEFLHLAGDRHREGLHHPDMLRDLEMRDLPGAELADSLRRLHLAGQQTDPRRDNLPELQIRQPHYLHFRDFWMTVE